jgi:hypothetical protein
MATVMSMRWAGISKQDYEAIRRETDFEGQKPTGGKYHIAWFEGDGIRVVDVWDSVKDFEQFAQSRLMPAAQKLGLKGEPKVEFHEAHNTFAPNP